MLGRFRCDLVLHPYSSIDGIVIDSICLFIQGLAIGKEEFRDFIGGAGDLVVEGLREDSRLDHGAFIHGPFVLVICIRWHSYPSHPGRREAA